MKKQAAKNITLNLKPLGKTPVKAWVSTIKHAVGPLLALSLADGTLVASQFMHKQGKAQIIKHWQTAYKNLHIQNGTPPKPANILKAQPAFGTAFQRAVWLALTFIRAGDVVAYGDIATAIGKPKAVRAVGNAVGKNPLAPYVPCHRVIAANGTLGGYTGGLPLKRALLKQEGTVF